MPNVWMTSPPLTILMIMTWKPTPPWKPVNPGLQGQEKEPMLYNLTKYVGEVLMEWCFEIAVRGDMNKVMEKYGKQLGNSIDK